MKIICRGENKNVVSPTYGDLVGCLIAFVPNGVPRLIVWAQGTSNQQIRMIYLGNKDDMRSAIGIVNASNYPPTQAKIYRDVELIYGGEG